MEMFNRKFVTLMVLLLLLVSACQGAAPAAPEPAEAPAEAAVDEPETVETVEEPTEEPEETAEEETSDTFPVTIEHTPAKEAEVAEEAAPAEEAVEPTVTPSIDVSIVTPVSLVEENETARVIQHAGGETAVPLDPQRIVSLEVDGSLLALGITPVAVAEWNKESYLAELLTEAEPIGYSDAYNLEAIAAAEPDLILLHTKPGGGIEVYDLLSEIAPTVVVSDPEADFRQTVRDIGLTLGREEAAEQRLAVFDEMAHAARETVGGIVGDGTAAMFNVREDHFRLYGIKVGYGGPTLYGELGMTPANLVTELVPEAQNARISLEVLPELDAQYLFVLAPEEVEQQYQALLAQPLWQSLPAVQAGNVYRVTADYWYNSEILAMERKIADALSLLETTVAAAPAETAPLDCEAGFRPFDHDLLATEPLCIPENPERIAFVDSTIDYAVALGVDSVTRSYYYDAFLGDFPNLADEAAISKMTDVGNTWEINAEAVVVAKPDLIVTSTWWPEANEQIQGIAPTVIFDHDRAVTWRESLDAVTQLTQKTEEQAELLAQIDERLATLRDTLGEKAAETTFTVVIIEGPAQLWLFTSKNFGAELAQEAGLTLPDSVPTPAEVLAATGSEYATSVSLEQLPLIEADHIFMFTNWNSGMEKELFASPVWQNFAASNPDRIHLLNGEYWVRDHPISAHRIIDDLFRMIAGVEPAEVSPNPFAYSYPQPGEEDSK